MGRASRTKGKRLELEAAALLKAHGIEARRNLDQYQATDGRDLTTEPCYALCVQVKGGQRPPCLGALFEAMTAAEPGELPVALVKQDRRPWVAVLPAVDLLELLALRKGMGRNEQHEREKTDPPPEAGGELGQAPVLDPGNKGRPTGGSQGRP